MFKPSKKGSRSKCLMMACVFMAFSHSVKGVVANNDFYTDPAGVALNVPAPGVLANDSGATLAGLVAGPQNGALTLNPDGSFVYTPTTNFTGVDGFTYVAVDGSATSAVTSVAIMVLAPGQLFYDNFARPTSSSAVFPWISSSNPNIVGSWEIANQELIGFSTLSNYALAYFANDGWSNYSVQAQVRFSANNAASAGIFGRLNTTSGAHYGAWIYPEESPEFLASGNGSAVLWLIKYDNWTWPYTLMGNPVTLPGVGVDWHNLKMTFQGSTISVYFDGALLESVTDDGSVDAYPPSTSGGIGVDLWTLAPGYAFSVDNVIVSTSNAVANSDSYNADTNATLQVAAPGVLANDSGGGSLAAILSGNPTYGSLALSSNGGFSYVPASGFFGTDTFTYQCTDGQTTSAVTTVTINVGNAVLVNSDTYALSNANTTLSVGAPGVVTNDLPAGKPLTVVLETGPSDGMLNLKTNGGFTYTITNNFVGKDSFTYWATDGQSTSGVALVTLILDAGPIANNDVYLASAGVPLNVPPPGVLQNDAGGSGSSSALLVGGPTSGALVLSTNGSFAYSPYAGFQGVDNFSYEATSGALTSKVAAVTIIVSSPSLLQNGGFETGDFTGWNQSGNIDGNESIASNSAFVHSGNYGAQLGPVSALYDLSQTVPTTPGQLYLVSFWLANNNGAGPNQFLAGWNGLTFSSETNVPMIIGWTNMQYCVAATGANSTLQFAFRNDPGSFGFDDVSVIAVPPPAFRSLAASGESVNLSWNAMAGPTYQLQYATNLAQTPWVNLGSVINGTNGEVIATDPSPAGQQRFYRLQISP